MVFCAGALGLAFEGSDLSDPANRVCAAILLVTASFYAVPHAIGGVREYMHTGTQSLRRAVARTLLTVAWAAAAMVFLITAADAWLQAVVSFVLVQALWLLERGNEGYAVAGAFLALLTLVGFNLPATLGALNGGPGPPKPAPPAPPGPGDDEEPDPEPLPPLDYDRPTAEPRRLGEEATYEERCRDAQTKSGERLPLVPGAGAPAPVDDQLYGLWLGRPGVDDGEGQLAAGCAQLAQFRRRPVPMWVAIGWCGRELRSIGVAPRARAPGLLLFRAARLARDLINTGRLRGASSRRALLSGEYFVLRTTRGPFVVVRRERGDEGAPTGDSTCSDYNPGARFTVVPPGLLRHWQRVVEDTWAWPEPDLSGSPGRGDHFRFVDDGTGETAATATCLVPRRCTLVFDGRDYPPARARPGTVKRILSFAR